MACVCAICRNDLIVLIAELYVSSLVSIVLTLDWMQCMMFRSGLDSTDNIPDALWAAPLECTQAWVD